jgi:hypothetical protein
MIVLLEEKHKRAKNDLRVENEKKMLLFLMITLTELNSTEREMRREGRSKLLKHFMIPNVFLVDASFSL